MSIKNIHQAPSVAAVESGMVADALQRIAAEATCPSDAEYIAIAAQMLTDHARIAAEIREAYENRTRDYYAQGEAYDAMRLRAEAAEARADALALDSSRMGLLRGRFFRMKSGEAESLLCLLGMEVDNESMDSLDHAIDATLASEVAA